MAISTIGVSRLSEMESLLHHVTALRTDLLQLLDEIEKDIYILLEN